MPSKQAEFIHKILKLLNIKDNHKLEAPKRKLQRENPPKHISKRFHIVQKKIRDQLVATMEPQNGDRISDIHIIYLHGGSYTMDAMPPHWMFMRKWIDRLGCRLTYLDYPLAPEHTYKDTFAMVSETYDALIRTYPNDDFVLMGDSAGAGLALAFLQYLKLHDRPLPDKSVLYSPWLDLSMQNPDNEILQEVDLDLSKASLIAAGALYAGGDDIRQYQLSPINGPLEGLGKIAVFYGTHEIFFADCEKLKHMVSDSSDDYFFYSYDQMQHVFILFPIPEADEAFEQTILFLSKDG